MNTENAILLLRDKETEPTLEVLENVMGKDLFIIYQELLEIFRFCNKLQFLSSGPIIIFLDIV